MRTDLTVAVVLVVGAVCEETRPPAGDPWRVLALQAPQLRRLVLLVCRDAGTLVFTTKKAKFLYVEDVVKWMYMYTDTPCIDVE